MAYGFGATTDVGASGSGTTQTLPVTYTVHDRAEVYITYGTGTPVSESLSDGTNTYSLVKQASDTTNNQTSSTYECKDCASGSFTITCTLGSSQPYRNICCTNYTSLDNSAANTNNGTNNANPGSAADAVTSTTATPGSQPAMVFGISMDSSGGESSLAAGTGFTNRGTMANTETAFGSKTRIEDKRVTSTSAVAATFTAGTGAGRFLTFVTIVPESGGAPAHTRIGAQFVSFGQFTQFGATPQGPY